MPSNWPFVFEAKLELFTDGAQESVLVLAVSSRVLYHM
jgi:hypothetical protein